ncbi:MAG TPA: LysM domain-containing protein [Candidatus Didemnitutus sp.]|nr:LysM domain-containing protein [Candidatus Didemnitutus sp.]
MDTLSRDSSSSSSSILPMVGVAAGVLALILSIVSLVKINKLNTTVLAQADEVAKIGTIQNDLHATAAKADGAETGVKQLRDGVQSALTQVGDQIGAMKGQIARLEEEAKKKPAGGGGKGKGAGVVTGTVDAEGNYVVAPGDTLNKIAKKFATNAQAIEAENPGLEPSKLHVGQKVKIPKK